MQSWLSYWDAPNKSYVNERHKRAHYEVLLDGIRPYLPAGPGRLVLDWGCGDALAAERIADVSGTVLLYDAAASTRDRLRRLHGSDSRLRVLDDSDVQGLARDSIDLIIVNSVMQYLRAQEMERALAWFHDVLRPGGGLLLGDIIAPGTPTTRHVATFLEFARKGGFLLPALGGLARTFVSPYRRLQREIGLGAYTPAQMLAKLEQHGFVAERLARNIAVSSHRSSYFARKPSRCATRAAAEPSRRPV